jgi:hypothetical protein
MLYDLLLTADHQAMSALEAEHATAGADVDVLDSALAQRRRAVDVVAVVNVAAVDDDVSGLHPIGELIDDATSDRGRDHDPGDARPPERLDELVERGGAGGALVLERLHRTWIQVIDDTIVPVTHQPADDVRAHPAQPDHSELHGYSSATRLAAR